MSVEGKQKYWEKHLPQWLAVHHKSHIDSLGSGLNSGLHAEKDLTLCTAVALLGRNSGLKIFKSVWKFDALGIMDYWTSFQPQLMVKGMMTLNVELGRKNKTWCCCFQLNYLSFSYTSIALPSVLGNGVWGGPPDVEAGLVHPASLSFLCHNWGKDPLWSD